MSRNTTTGTTYEDEIAKLLLNTGRYKVERQKSIGIKRNGGTHIVDILINDKELISLKYQSVQGTAEEKIPFEVLKLQQAIDDHKYDSATIVLSGKDEAWKWKEYFLGEDFKKYIVCPNVRIIDHKTFLTEYIDTDSSGTYEFPMFKFFE